MTEPTLSCWLRNAPAANPKLWIALNGACCVSSLLIELVLVSEGNSINVLPIYAMYNFGTTVVWCFEAAMSLSYACAGRPLAAELIGHFLLLSAALYFLVTSIILFQDIMEPPEQLGEYELDVVISFICNVLAILYVCWEQRRGENDSAFLPKDDTASNVAVEVVDQYGRLA